MLADITAKADDVLRGEVIEITVLEVMVDWGEATDAEAALFTDEALGERLDSILALKKLSETEPPAEGKAEEKALVDRDCGVNELLKEILEARAGFPEAGGPLEATPDTSEASKGRPVLDKPLKYWLVNWVTREPPLVEVEVFNSPEESNGVEARSWDAVRLPGFSIEEPPTEEPVVGANELETSFGRDGTVMPPNSEEGDIELPE